MKVLPFCRESAAVVVVALGLAACQTASAPPDGLERRVIALEYGTSPTRKEVAEAIVAAANACWLNRDPAFANLTVSPIGPGPAPETYSVTFKDPKQLERTAVVNILSPRSTDGWMVQVIQKRDVINVADAMRPAMTRVERKAAPC